MALAPSPMLGGGQPAPSGPPGGVGGATTPTAMPGMMHQGMSGVKTALEMLQKSVSELPMGSPLHQKVLKFIADISKELGSNSEQGGSDVAQRVASMARQGPNPQAQAAMSKLFPQQGGGGATPPQPPMGQ